MIKLYVMEGNYVNTEDELEKDGSENSVKGAYEVNICDWEYQNEQGNTVTIDIDNSKDWYILNSHINNWNGVNNNG